jgi:hypothetical protein
MHIVWVSDKANIWLIPWISFLILDTVNALLPTPHLIKPYDDSVPPTSAGKGFRSIIIVDWSPFTEFLAPSVVSTRRPLISGLPCHGQCSHAIQRGFMSSNIGNRPWEICLFLYWSSSLPWYCRGDMRIIEQSEFFIIWINTFRGSHSDNRAARSMRCWSQKQWTLKRKSRIRCPLSLIRIRENIVRMFRAWMKYTANSFVCQWSSFMTFDCCAPTVMRVLTARRVLCVPFSTN